MKPLSSIEIMLCQKQAKLFEKSMNKTDYSSPIFIRRFMHSSIAELFDRKVFLYTTIDDYDVFDIVNEEFGKSSYGKEKYTEDQMYWIGYIYRCISIRYNLSSRTVFKLFNAREIVKYYNIGHTFDIVDCAERMMENIHYDESPIEERAYRIMKEIILEKRIVNYLNQNVYVIINHPVGQNDNGKIYNLNCGYIATLKKSNKKYQDAYVIGVNKPLKEFKGKVTAIVKGNDKEESKLVVCEVNKTFTKEEIKELINFKKKNYKSRIIMSK